MDRNVGWVGKYYRVLGIVGGGSEEWEVSEGWWDNGYMGGVLKEGGRSVRCMGVFGCKRDRGNESEGRLGGGKRWRMEGW